jgi:TolB-like protein/class 3 adenylate cyclase
MATERRLAAIMFTDIVGYTALMAESEEKGLRVRARHREAVRPLVERYHGEWIESPGDQTLSTFPTALDAVDCGLALLAALEDDAELNLHVGIHSGDIVVAEGEITGDGVNIAARLCPLSKGSDLCVSGEVYRSVRNQPEIEATALGEQKLKNVPEPVAVYSITGTAAAPSPVAKPARVSRATGLPRAALAVAALVVIAIGAGWWLYRPAPTLSPIRSLAVLPLDNLSADPEQQYFADGMTDAVISEFAKIGALRVISWTSVKQYRNTQKPLPEIASELDVEGIVEGTVLRAGERVRITLQLIDARNDHHLWAQSYERDLSDVLALQGEVARGVAKQVALELTGDEEARLRTTRKTDPEAHEAYLRGTLHLAEASALDTYKAIEYFEQAIERDPELAGAWAGLADAYRVLGWGLSELPPADAAAKIRAAAERALSLDGSLARAHASLGDLIAQYEWRWAEAEEELRRAVDLSPSDPIVNNRYGLYLTAIGRHDEALPLLQTAVDVDPTSLHWRSDKALTLFEARDYERAVEEYLKILEVDPGFFFALMVLPWAYIEQDLNAEAFDAWVAFHRATGRDQRWLNEFQQGYRDAGIRGALRFWLEADTARAKTEYVDPVWLTTISAYLGETDVAFALLERLHRARSPHLPQIIRSKTFDPLRSDPRFDDLVRRIGFPES